MEKPEGKGSFERPRYGEEGNIKMDLDELEWKVMDWVNVAQFRVKCRPVVNTPIKLPIS